MRCQIVIDHFLVAVVAVNGRLPLGRDRTNLDVDAVACCFEVINSMIVTARAIPVFPTAPKVPTGQTKPKIVSKCTLLACCQMLRNELLCACLIQGEGMLARLQLKLPFLHSRCLESRLSQENRVYNGLHFFMVGVKFQIAVMAENFSSGFIFVLVCIDAAWLTDGELGHLGESIALLLNLPNVEHQRLALLLINKLRVLRPARSDQAFEADVKAVFCVWRAKALAALILVDHPSLEVIRHVVGVPAGADASFYITNRIHFSVAK